MMTTPAAMEIAMNDLVLWLLVSGATVLAGAVVAAALAWWNVRKEDHDG